MKKIKFFAVFSAFSLFLMMMQPVFAVEAGNFNDVSASHANYKAITELKTKGIVGGYSDNTFKPDNKINRAELTKIVVEAVYPGQATGANCFPDVKDEWFAKYVCFAQSKGLINGYPDGKFYPNENINYVEALKITLGTFSYDPMETTDVWYQAYLNVAGTLGVGVSTDNTEKLSRGKMAQLISNILGCLKPDTFTSKAGNFGITFPGKHLSGTYPMESGGLVITLHMYGFKTSEKVFLLDYSDMPDATIQAKTAQALLQDEKNGALSSLGVLAVDEEKEVKYKGYPGLFYKGKNTEENGYVVAQTYLVGNRLYQMEILATGSYPTDAEVDAFIGTFKLLK
ncbi:MAG: S-layer homology domain-containing protein [Candidatus Gracilibacteria bacterium]|jgi:hypothetical protein